jgi:hypothetical protein
MGHIALQDLGRSERRLTYTYGLRLQDGEELEEQGRGAYWQITGLRLWMDGYPFIKTGEPPAAKVVVKANTGKYSADTCLHEA